MSQPTQRICILGGGFGGLYTALRLSELPWTRSQQPEIILIDKSDRFLFSPLLYELVSGEMQTWEIAPPYEELLTGTGIRLERATATSVDFDTQTIHCEEAPPLNYDYLVLAIGGKTPVDIVPGAQDHAIPFRSLGDAYRLQERLRSLEQSDREFIRVAVVGGGYSGVEIACKLADRLGDRGRLRIIDRASDILRDSTEFNRKTAQVALQARHIWLDLDTDIANITADSITLDYKNQIDTIPVDLVLWTIGTKVADFVKNLDLEHNQKGQIAIAPTLQTPQRPEIFAVGDLAACQDINGQNIPPTAQAALQQADYCAWNLWATMTNRPLLPFRYQPLGEMMALGTHNATVSGLGIQLDGTIGHLARRAAYLYRLPTLKHRLTVGLNWVTQPILELLSK
ncbi:MAG: NAD(P)/FAD-dependent oxidoreductase [Jaaginema sp. PMC 1079.18]|nr:NAD(P)/FAD-dependent oxidoreductase [Jaaginema sp. PMC 1080.18]MEC4849488.1 NAD(P)/FAD-dependent oxidoreductase [Jaaginema sp. PMC 1079.18]MEC4866009.1 NAD(P)/FAD-dependent oxidoreductase [Jaaginema sp. PMC 1078.18]